MWTDAKCLMSVQVSGAQKLMLDSCRRGLQSSKEHQFVQASLWLSTQVSALPRLTCILSHGQKRMNACDGNALLQAAATFTK